MVMCIVHSCLLHNVLGYCTGVLGHSGSVRSLNSVCYVQGVLEHCTGCVRALYRVC